MTILIFMVDSEKKPLLQIRDYHFQFPSYPGLMGTPLFRGLNWTLNRGEFWIVLGRPESGKTTLGRCLTGVYPGLTQAETSGEILIDGEPVGNRSACDWIEKTGIVFQDPEEQIITTRCDDEASLALESLGSPAHEIRTRMEESFREFAMTGHESRNPISLSGGEKKRLLLASLEMQNPDLWILDESMDELDRDGQIFLLEYLRKKAVEMNKGILLFASKYKDLFREAGAELALLWTGRMVTQRTDPDGFQTSLQREGLLMPPQIKISSPGNTERSSTPLLSLKNITYTYPGSGGFSLSVDRLDVGEGEILGIEGPNGCGKTTLVRILSGLIPPAGGEILFRGVPVRRDILNRSCGYLFQNPDYQLFLPTIQEELGLGLKNSGQNREEIKEMIDRAISLFKLPSSQAPPALMSFGTRKRLQGAIYYLLDKDLYILDEADSGLNFTDYLTIIQELKSKNAALIIISHDIQIQSLGIERVIRMENGQARERTGLHD